MNFREKLLQLVKDNGNRLLNDHELLDFSKIFIEELSNNHIDSFKLFRYMPFNYDNVRSIELGRIYLSELGKMNDIFEGLTLSLKNKEISLSDLYDLAYIKAFSEENNDLLMWSHYGDNHNGLCVEYDLKQLVYFKKRNENIKNDWKALYHLFPVVYSDTRLDDSYALSSMKWASGSIEDYKLDVKRGDHSIDTTWHEDIRSLFLYKSKDWTYEKEWRVVVTFHQLKGCSEDDTDDNNELYGLYDQHTPFDCISAVYCGVNLSKERLDHMKEIVLRINTTRKNENREEIKLYRLSLNKDRYVLDQNLIEL